jgi:RHS repeat-associated protein
VQTYTYDEENRLTGAAGYTYTYDGDGNRVRKSNGNLAANGTLYWYMTPGVVAESDLAGTLKSEYVFFDGERVARRDGATGTGGVFYYFSDHLKTASVITDSAGVIKAESDYYPWGGELQFVNNDSNDYKFTGKKRDLETGLDYFGARYYSNGLGRFVSADWSATPVPVPYADFGDPQSLNLYAYVRNIPTTGTDVEGHQCPACQVINQIDSQTPVDERLRQAGTPQALIATAIPIAVAVAPEAGPLVQGLIGLAGVTAPTTVPIAQDIIEGATPGAPGPKLPTASTLSKAEQLVVNKAAGKAAEQAVVTTLKKEGREILGQQVGVKTSQGLRKVDVLTKDAAGKLANVEVKSGGAVRNASQVAKDNEIAAQGGTYVGKNTPESMRGQTVKVPTEVKKPDQP